MNLCVLLHTRHIGGCTQQFDTELNRNMYLLYTNAIIRATGIWFKSKQNKNKQKAQKIEMAFLNGEK